MGLREIFGDIITLFAIINPIGSLSIILRIAPDIKKKKLNNVFDNATILGFFILLIFSLIGKMILEKVFHLSLSDLLIAGGLILLVISIKSIVFQRFTRQEMDTFKSEEIGSFPIAFPLLVGPGALITGVLILQKHGFVTTVIIILAVFILVWLVLRFMDPLVKYLGNLGLRVISKIMYIFLGAIAIKFIIDGISLYFTK